MNDMQEIIEASEQNQKQVIPEHTLEALNRYLDKGIQPGGFLTAFLCNDLKEAFRQADDINIANMYGIMKYIYCNVPSVAWGSPENVENWIKMRNEK